MGRVRELVFAAAFLLFAGTISPGFAVPEASTTSLVLPADGGLKGAGPDDPPACSQGFGGRSPAAVTGLRVKTNYRDGKIFQSTLIKPGFSHTLVTNFRD